MSDSTLYRAGVSTGRRHEIETTGIPAFLEAVRVREEAAGAPDGWQVTSLALRIGREWRPMDHLLDPPPPKMTLYGNDNQGKPCQGYADQIAPMSDDEFVKAAELAIWLSAYASNNPRSDYHWQADACYAEAARRRKPELYQRAFDQARASAGL